MRAIDVYSVIIRIMNVRLDIYALKGNVCGIVYPIRPARRLIYHCDVLYYDIFAGSKKYNTGWGQGFNTAKAPAVNARILERLYKEMTVTVYGSPASDRNILTALGKYKGCISSARKQFRVKCNKPIRLGIIITVG
jgi:hypothetical protein